MASGPEMKLEELAEQSGVAPRTIRLYISQGLLPGPLRSGRNAAYGPEHLGRLAAIRELQQKGLTLTQARWALEGRDLSQTGGPLPEPESWREYSLAPDVRVSLREGVSPWRARALREALAQFNRLLNEAGETEENGHD